MKRHSCLDESERHVFKPWATVQRAVKRQCTCRRSMQRIFTCIWAREISGFALCAADAPAQTLQHLGRNEAAHVATKAEDFFQHARADEGIAPGRLQKNRLDLGSETPVHQRHLKLVFV